MLGPSSWATGTIAVTLCPALRFISLYKEAEVSPLAIIVALRCLDRLNCLNTANPETSIEITANLDSTDHHAVHTTQRHKKKPSQMYCAQHYFQSDVYNCGTMSCAINAPKSGAKNTHSVARFGVDVASWVETPRPSV